MLSIARALMASPKLLMLDEPTWGLAPLVVEEIMRVIKRLNQEGTTVLLVEQNARQALAVVQRCYVLEVGRVAFSGTPAAEAAGEVRDRLAEIAAWSSAILGQARIPLLWRILARNPHYLDATWQKEVAVMGDGALAARDKRRIALGVAMSVRGRYMIEYHAAILRRAGDTDADLLEVLGVVDHYTTLNTLSEGMQIDSDIRPPT